MRDETRERYVARLGSVLAGFLVLNMKGAFVGYIQTVCVSPEFRGRGIGTKLVEFAEERILPRVAERLPLRLVLQPRGAPALRAARLPHGRSPRRLPRPRALGAAASQDDRADRGFPDGRRTARALTRALPTPAPPRDSSRPALPLSCPRAGAAGHARVPDGARAARRGPDRSRRCAWGTPFLLRSVDAAARGGGGTARAWRSRASGKRIVFALEGDLFLVLHLMIAGRLHWKPRGAKVGRPRRRSRLSTSRTGRSC